MTRPKRSKKVLLATTALVGCCAAIVAVYAQCGPRRGDATSVASNTAAPTFPLTCNSSHALDIVSRKHEGGGTLVVAASDCKIRIRDSQLKGDVVVLASRGAVIEVTNSSLEGRDVAIRTDAKAKVRVSTNSVIKGTVAAVATGTDADVMCADSRLDAVETALLLGKNNQVELKRCHVQAVQAAVKASVNLKLHTLDATIRAGHVAIHPSTSLELVAQGGLIQSDGSGIVTDGFMPSITLTGGAALEAKESAIEVQANLKLHLNGSSIRAGKIGVDGKANAEVELRSKSRVISSQVGLRFTVNADISLRDSSIEAGRHAICGEYNTAISAESATIQAKSDALHLASEPRRYAVESSHLVGRTNYAAKNCVF